MLRPPGAALGDKVRFQSPRQYPERGKPSLCLPSREGDGWFRALPCPKRQAVLRPCPSLQRNSQPLGTSGVPPTSAVRQRPEGQGKVSQWVKEKRKETSHVEHVSGRLLHCLSPVRFCLVRVPSTFSPPPLSSFFFHQVQCASGSIIRILVARNTRQFPSFPRGGPPGLHPMPRVTEVAFLLVTKVLFVRTPASKLRSRKIWGKHQCSASQPSPQAIYPACGYIVWLGWSKFPVPAMVPATL